jgi:hypothetical protein
MRLMTPAAPLSASGGGEAEVGSAHLWTSVPCGSALWALSGFLESATGWSPLASSDLHKALPIVPVAPVTTMRAMESIS